MQSLTLTGMHMKQMVAHVNAHAPLEACGLLAGQDSTVESVIEVANQARSAVRFVMDPIGQLKAFEWMESNNLELVGIFHSHPAGPETVSPTDVSEAAYAVANVILARVDDSWRARGFWIEGGTFREISLLAR
jgi:proteasome lid subunit RPN8/RPN11